ncbi:hypothetical protein [Hyphococcus sp.]|uniref:hypothetical protein n=1 Tax=Hyphococcus sp. TaxID=2038636 RepID=UPI0035C69F71
MLRMQRTMIRSGAVAAVAALGAIVAAPAAAATVEISFSGSTDGAGGNLTYPDGGTFSGRVIYETDAVADDSASPSFGSFEVSPLLIELNTPLGGLSYAPDPSRQPANVMTFTQQENLAEQQTSRLSFGSNELDYDGFDGMLAGFTPISFDLVLQTNPNPGGDVLFSDPNALLSGADSLITAMLINSVVQVVFTNDAMDNIGTTTLAINSVAFNILDVTTPPGEVPLPGAAILLLTGLGGLFAARKGAGSRAGAPTAP